MSEGPPIKRVRFNEPVEFKEPAIAFNALQLRDLMKQRKGRMGTVFNKHEYADQYDGLERDKLSAKQTASLKLVRDILFSGKTTYTKADNWCVDDVDMRGSGLTIFPDAKEPEEAFQINDEATVVRNVDDIYENHACVSAYGDLEHVQTFVNEDIRKSRDLPYRWDEEQLGLFAGQPDAIQGASWRIGSRFLMQLALKWQDCMDEFDVVVVPHKLVMYKEGDHFSPHRDTPDTNLVGSIVLGLCDTSTGGGLVLDSDDKSRQPSSFGNYWFFRPDVLHEVERIVGGTRCVLTFKVYAREPACRTPHSTCSLKDHTQCLALATALAELVKEGKGTLTDGSAVAGFLLVHEYSRGSTALQGSDHTLLCAAILIPGLTVLKTIPVRIDFETSEYDEEEMDVKMDVHSLEDHVLSNIQLGLPVEVETCDFYNLSTEERGTTYKAAHARGGFTGNQAEPSTDSCIYVHRALIVGLCPTE